MHAHTKTPPDYHIANKTIGKSNCNMNHFHFVKDPVLFMGPVRRNLDPFDQYCDDDVWNALKQARALMLFS